MQKFLYAFLATFGITIEGTVKPAEKSALPVLLSPLCSGFNNVRTAGVRIMATSTDSTIAEINGNKLTIIAPVVPPKNAIGTEIPPNAPSRYRPAPHGFVPWLRVAHAA